MGDNQKRSNAWRIIVGILAICFIIFLWIKKDIAAIYTTMPREQILPMLAMTIAVSLFKVGVIAGIALLIKWIVGKVKKR